MAAGQDDHWVSYYESAFVNRSWWTKLRKAPTTSIIPRARSFRYLRVRTVDGARGYAPISGCRGIQQTSAFKSSMTRTPQAFNFQGSWQLAGEFEPAYSELSAEAREGCLFQVESKESEFTWFYQTRDDGGQSRNLN